MATIPVFSPAIPFLGEIPGGLAVGKCICIRGQVIGDGMFNINLQSGAAVNPRDDTPLHISVRPGDKKIVRNSFAAGAWQEEERDGKSPIGAGESFKLQIKVKESYYTLKVDGKKFCKFKHRLAIDQARFVHIGEGGVIESITEEGQTVWNPIMATTMGGFCFHLAFSKAQISINLQPMRLIFLIYACSSTAKPK